MKAEGGAGDIIEAEPSQHNSLLAVVLIVHHAEAAVLAGPVVVMPGLAGMHLADELLQPLALVSAAFFPGLW